MTDKKRKVLYPFSVLFEGVTKVRNRLYDKKYLKSNTFEIPLILVGNLRVGGTGKTPQVAYLVKLLHKKYKVAVLSRGYKRKTSGFVLANSSATVQDIGDEALQIYKKYPEISVAVDADRTHGIRKLQALDNPPEAILLDDAFQHRKIKAGFNILLTSYDDLYVDDTHLPSGNLREHREGAERAQVIIVTKCPETLTEEDEYKTATKLNPTLEQTVFFSKIKYADFIQNIQESIAIDTLSKYEIVLLTGIANPKPLLRFFDSLKLVYTHVEFPDHHNFTKKNIELIQHTYNEITNKKKLLITTEKDYVRIFDTSLAKNELYYIGIETTFINHQKDFDKLILDYVEKNTRNS